MDDMTAFERLIANTATKAVGPPRAVDGRAVVRSAKATSAGRWSLGGRWFPRDASIRPEGGFSMFGALKFVAAAAIVALFGGFLLAGVLTMPQGDDVAPAAVTESPSLMKAEELLAGMITEEVEPGVFRVVDDGVRDLTSVDAEDIVAGYDGGTWLVREDGVLRLGGDETHQWPPIPRGDHAFEVAPDGTMWVIPFGSGWYPREAREGHHSTDGEEWTVQPCPRGGHDCQGFSVAPDGTVWASWKEEGGWRVGRLGPTGWQPLDGYARSGRARGYHHIHVTNAGDIYGLDHAKIYRFEDGDWEFVSEQPLTFDIGALVDVGRDGTVWLGNDDGLTRFADGEKEHWSMADILGPSYDFSYDDEPLVDYVGETQYRVAPDGSLWFSPWQRCPSESGSVTWCGDGLARFDGQTLDRFLRGQHVSMDIAADGSIWILAAEETLLDLDVGHVDGGGPRWVPGDGPRGLYVITPKTETPGE